MARYVKEKEYKILNLCHIPEDGRLKTLSFSVTDEKRILEILNYGERVDGSSLFSGIEPGSSDVYIKPRIHKSFTNPFTLQKTINVLCDYLNHEGDQLNVAPQTILNKAQRKLEDSTGLELQTFAELEFYVVSRNLENVLFSREPDRNYHESSPFAIFENLRNYILSTLETVGIPTKYGHSEVGCVVDGCSVMEQHEIELLPDSPANMADSIAVSKWIIRNACAVHGVGVSFSPKVSAEHAGTGMHIHISALKKRRNAISSQIGDLTDTGLQMIGGILNHASSLSAFANILPISYVRFIARKESPMGICWGARNRAALIRIPLWWIHERRARTSSHDRETFEYRAPDALANPHLLLSGLALSICDGVKSGVNSLRLAKDLHRNSDIACNGHKHLRMLPHSCSEAADALEHERNLYEADGVFPERLIDRTIERLRSYDDKGMWQRLLKDHEELRKVLDQYQDRG